VRDLLSRFVTAIDAEIALIEKESRDQSFELLSGQRAEGSTGALYVFIMADALRLPEDASGQLKAGGAEFPAMVVAQEGNRIWVLVESIDELPSYFPAARLVLNETELLKRLREKILLLGSGSDLGLAPKVFGRESSREGVSTVPPFVEHHLGSSPQTLIVLAQCLGSEVTFLWGPPGTGKTFTIAALVASLASLGETVLVTSHTHVAVEQALWALIEHPEENRAGGLLFESSLVSDGRILKVGKRRLEKIPRSVELECYLEDKAKERGETVRTLEEERDRVTGIVAALTSESQPWSDLAAATTGLSLASADHEATVQSYAESRRLLDAAKARLDTAKVSERQAERSFFLGRAGRVAKARRTSAEIRGEVGRAEAAAGVAEARVIRLRATLADADAALLRARAASAGLRQESQLQTELASAEERRGTLQSEIDALNDSAREDANELIHNAAAIFATLTKLYMDRGALSDMRWDTVVIDEASMAMPPLVAYAAAHARKRVVIVGDPFQLPPVVHSGSDTEGGELGKDVFELRGVKDMIEAGVSPAYLATLRTQWRMHPDIVSVAKELISAYSFLETAHGLGQRNAVGVHDALNTTAPLITVDISGFHPWSGKMPGSLSRFNFVSAQACVEIASLYAASLAEPNENAAPPIGIVTPYAAQRRYLNKLIEMLNLGRWVMAGTVHTFQGNECDVIIFDSVLGEPHWTARLTNPFSFEEVKRDLNVALTRARHQFVFVGDSKWLRKNAKPASAYGKLWGYMEKHADHLDATELLGDGFRTRVAQGVSDVNRWTFTRRSLSLFSPRLTSTERSPTTSTKRRRG
jgi:AAA domain